jgi:hypothetical protein
MAQTAVEWLKKEVEEYGDREYLIIRWTDLDELINQAKQMEKEQMKKSWFDSTTQFDNSASMVDKKEFEQYYNETFGK